VKKITGCALAFMILLGSIGVASAGTLAREMLDLDTGWAHFSFDPRPGVSGNCETIVLDGRDGTDHMTVRFHHEGEDDGTTFQGPVHVQLRFRHGELVFLDTCIGDSYEPPRSDQLTDFGHISPDRAAETLLALAREDGPDAEDCIMPATLARDFDDWRSLLELARDGKYSENLRQRAIFWLGEAASVVASEGLEKLVADDDEQMEIREHAIFALSRQDGEYVPLLMDIARTNPHPQLRRSALFWLAQSDDDRVLGLFEEILLAD
jgi:hypothetical protein